MIPILLYVAGTAVVIIGIIYSTKQQTASKGVLSLLGFLFVAILLWLGAYYLSHSDKQEGVFMYNNPSGNTDMGAKWDRITDDGKYISQSSGKEYMYYVVVRGNEYEFNGEQCADIDDLRSRFEKIKRENTVIIIDSFAVAARIHDLENMLDELGINYEFEEYEE